MGWWWWWWCGGGGGGGGGSGHEKRITRPRVRQQNQQVFYRPKLISSEM